MVRSDISAANPPPDDATRVLRAVRIPMRDGVVLNAMVFLPRGATDPVPVVMQMTPYGLDVFYATGRRFTGHGLALAVIDCRGRGDSQGRFEMFETDINDTVDAIDWLAKQGWCDGQIAMYGGSYSGTNQWIAAKSRPSALKGIAPWGAAYLGVDLPPGGIPFIGHLTWYILTGGQDTLWGLASDTAGWARRLADLYVRHGSALELAREFGLENSPYAKILRDPFYAMRAMTFLPTDDEIRQIDIPILSSTGHYDSTHPGTLQHFLRHEEFGSARARAKHSLVIGPWHHAGMDGTDVVSGLSFGPAARLEMAEVRLQWFRWVFGLGEKPQFLSHRIMYYMAGAEQWRGGDSLDEIIGEPRRWFLSSQGGANDIFHSGDLGETPADTPSDRFVADPFDFDIIKLELGKRSWPRPHKEGTSLTFPDPIRGLHLQIAGEDPTDQAFAYNLNGQGVIYHSAPLQQDFEIAGFPQLDLWLTLDAPDTDLIALLSEILPEDGDSILIWSNMLRLRYRDSWREPVLAEPGVPFSARFTMPKFMSRRLRKGSRLRLVIRSPASIQFQKNLNSGKEVADERPEDARRCTVQVLHEPGRQTVLTLPTARCGS